MKVLKKVGHLGGLAHCGLLLSLLLGGGAGSCNAAGHSAEIVVIMVEDITYRGNDEYGVNITLSNRSDKEIEISEYHATFAVQTEILGRWKEVGFPEEAGGSRVILSPRSERQSLHRLNIPPDLPSLYKNGEGDINMLFTYLLVYRVHPEDTLRRKEGESSFWITPGTGSWILREGM